MSRLLPEARIQALHTRYVRVIDDNRLEDWPGLFVANGRYEITTRENHAGNFPLALMSCHGRGMMQDRITGLRRINVYEPHVYRHQVCALEIGEAGQGNYRCLSNFQVVRIMHSGAMSLFATGIYQDLVREDEDGEFRFVERIAITDSRQIDTLLVIPL